ncbi:hypothetical protein A3D77_06745 [Candidatus Gottesmanbacteria bacterium RIFCSPHIGHO2_02_FULL_39_11]|uniref:Uncharacterized protein n=1 Tax=Candidatus Gottesmanbacteria bacterium RIFCSPHIGHO2_02_FULL_39_11 TaxID=1798382 RepID=A0A1F5ZT57_9BACT|nr:MAG: hypothetical protein A3D77_06745 [Candidatus Gottesmanbacteria bacterium RIFCSPHIGHO2_02_FULL_39_11]
MRITSIILILLGLLAVFLIGIKVGINIPKSINQLSSITSKPSPSLTTTPTIEPSPTETIPDKSPSPTKSDVKGVSTRTSNGNSIYTDSQCGFSLSYRGSYLNSKSANGQATILTDPKNTNASIAVTCLDKVPRPPVSSDKIESITLSGEPATLYHDTEREIVIVKNPNTQKEILLAGTNPLFSTILKTFELL